MSSNKIVIEDNKSNFSIYHQALVDLIGKVFSGQVAFEPVDTAFDYAIKQSGNNLKFPFISIYNAPNIEISNMNNNYAAIKEGMPMFKEVPIFDENGKYLHSSNKVVKNVKNLYINIEYQIDIWATTRQCCEEVTQELVFWLYENRELSIKYYGRELYFTFTVGDNILDNTDLTAYEQSNKLYRMSLNIILTCALYRTENYFSVLDPQIDIGYKEENK